MKSKIILLVSCLVLSLLTLVIVGGESHFISYINQKGFRGNITFSIAEEDSTSIFVIEAILEADRAYWIKDQGNENDFDPSQPIQFDWSIYSNTLDPHMLSSCSKDESGYLVENHRHKHLFKEKPILLDRRNRWSIPIKDLLLDDSPSKFLSTNIWGKSIRLRLSDTHKEKAGLSKNPETPAQTSPLPPRSISKDNKPNVRTSSSISRPQLIHAPAPVANNTNFGKPTFAPRPKPSLSSRAKPTTTSPRIIKRHVDPSESPSKSELDESLSAPRSKQNSTSTSSQPTTLSTPSSGDKVLEATHRKIVRIYGNINLCANIIDTRNVKTAEAIFDSQIGGKVTIRGNEDDITILILNLYHIRSKVTTRHEWVIMASDILDNRREDERCKYLQVIFDPNNLEDSKCKRNDTYHCRMGDLSKKHGHVQVAGQGRSTRTTLVDLNLPISALDGSRPLFLVIYEVASKTSNNGLQVRPSILSCAPIKTVEPRKAEAVFSMFGVRGSIRISQRHITELAHINYDLFGLEGNIKHQSIHELPLVPRRSADKMDLCSHLGEVFNPTSVNSVNVHTLTTIDNFPIGNLSAKHGPLSVIDSEYEDHYMGEMIDPNIQLFGYHSIIGRSILLSKNSGDPWVCATLNYADLPINLAVVTFFYPVVGQISFQQIANEPHSETSVLVEVYNPNGEKDSSGHNWLVHSKPAMADFYNWSMRCDSAGEVFDPIQSSIGLGQDVYSRQCQSSITNEPLRCKAGDTTMKSGIKMSLPKSPLDRKRHFYTDLFLPLSGHNSIIGRSVVIYDDNSPVQRGNRLACSNIKMVHPLKASVKSWDSGPSIPSAIRGIASFEQDSPVKATRVKLDISGFNGNVENYAIHNVWTMDDREFPCSNDSLYDIYDPYDSEKSLKSHPMAHYGLSATTDRVKVGDMSRKHGTLEGLQSIQRTFIDANLPLFAPYSIIGRSVVLRAAVNDFRWVCGNVDLDHDKSYSRELVGLASFDDPRSKIAGYMRFYQLEHKDGSLSDTFIQIDLRTQHMSGSGSTHEMEVSVGHDWVVFVNQVGEDAFIAADDVRCIAAGFKWNPYLAQDKLEEYPLNSCTETEQLGCAMGDLGLRHGQLVLGPNNRRTVSDANLPLVGNYSVMGRSLVIFDNKRPNVKLACANIFPDIHLKSNVVIKRTPSFTVARFVEQMRSLLGAADWLLIPELRATKHVANGECVQMTIHFYGQRAHQMQVELNNLITLGTVRKSTRAGTEKVSTHYKLCRSGQAQLASSSLSPIEFHGYSMLILSVIYQLIIKSFWLT